MILGCSPSTVARHAKAGTLPTVTKIPTETGPYLFDAAAIQRIAAAKGLRCPHGCPVVFADLTHWRTHMRTHNTPTPTPAA